MMLVQASVKWGKSLRWDMKEDGRHGSHNGSKEKEERQKRARTRGMNAQPGARNTALAHFTVSAREPALLGDRTRPRPGAKEGLTGDLNLSVKVEAIEVLETVRAMLSLSRGHVYAWHASESFPPGRRCCRRGSCSTNIQ